MVDTTNILIFDSDPETVTLISSVFEATDFRFVGVETVHKAAEELRENRHSVVFADLPVEGSEGFAFLTRVQRNFPAIPIIAIANSSESRIAIEAVKAGAFDFLTKPLDDAELKRSLTEAIETSKRSREPVAINPKEDLGETTDTLVGNSRAMLDVYKNLGRLSPTPVTVLIRGETGTGKELVARALYQYGHRAHKPFITVNCAAIPDNLLESELFGHEKGSFTGAVGTRIGKFEQANNATLFLDEIGDLDHSLQAKLLRVLQEKRFQRVGGNKEISVDVRIIAATHRPIEKMIAGNEFREDLFYRLNVATIKLPPLRDRLGDVPLLTAFFLKRFSVELGLPPVSITRTAVSRLESDPLPGNVRQLQNIVRKALLRSRGYAIDREMIDELLAETEPAAAPGGDLSSLNEYCRTLISEAVDEGVGSAHEEAVGRVEAILIDEALRQSRGNISQASKWLGLSRLTIREKAKKYGISTDR